MKKLAFIFVLIFCFGCKKQLETKVKVENIEEESRVEDLNEDQQILTTEAKLVDSIYKWVDVKEFSDLQIRTVKAKNGLNIRDSLGNKIGKLVFGEVVYILEYSKDTKEVRDNGRIIKGRTAKIVTKWSSENIKTSENSYKHNWYVLKENIGYVFDGFLYENHKDNDENSLYNYGYLVVGEKGEASKIDLRELLEIEKIRFSKYESRIIKELEFKQPNTIKKVNKVIELPFENGKKLILKDSTYNSEYSPTRSYSVFYHKDFSDSYMVSESMFFMPDIHTELSVKTGDTLNRFNGYPYISPNKDYAVLITHDLTECYHDTAVEIHEKGLDNKYRQLLSFVPQLWSYPFKSNDKGSMDDIFTINWIGDNEFIINTVDYIDDCYAPDQLSKPYYLKFKIKI